MDISKLSVQELRESLAASARNEMTIREELDRREREASPEREKESKRLRESRVASFRALGLPKEAAEKAADRDGEAA